MPSVESTGVNPCEFIELSFDTIYITADLSIENVLPYIISVCPNPLYVPIAETGAPSLSFSLYVNGLACAPVTVPFIKE